MRRSSRSCPVASASLARSFSKLAMRCFDEGWAADRLRRDLMTAISASASRISSRNLSALAPASGSPASTRSSSVSLRRLRSATCASRSEIVGPRSTGSSARTASMSMPVTRPRIVRSTSASGHFRSLVQDLALASEQTKRGGPDFEEEPLFSLTIRPLHSVHHVIPWMRFVTPSPRWPGAAARPALADCARRNVVSSTTWGK